MNPRLKCIARLPSMECSEDSDSHVCDGIRNGSPTASESSTIENEAALLLSISSICDREVRDRGFDAIFDDEMPRFPCLRGATIYPDNRSVLIPRPELHQENTSFRSLRARAVSIDSPRLTAMDAAMDMDRSTSPVSLPASETMSFEPVVVSPGTPRATVRRVQARKQSLRLAKQSRFDSEGENFVNHRESNANISGKSSKGRTLQECPPKGTPIKKIGRKKFSWKCYPEVSRLAHSHAISLYRFLSNLQLHNHS